MSKTVQFITRTAIILALTLLFQSLRTIIPIPKEISIYIIGSLVNLCLIIAALVVGIKGGVIISILAPVIAFFQGHLPQFPLMIPLVAVGNAVIVIIVALFYKKNKYMALISGAVLKFVVLYLTIVKWAVPLVFTKMPDKVKMVLSVNFSWPQLVTAIIAGLIALIVLPLLNKAIKFDSDL